MCDSVVYIVFINHCISAFLITSRARSGIVSGTFHESKIILSLKRALIALLIDSASSMFERPSSKSAEQEETGVEIDNDDDWYVAIGGTDAIRDENWGKPISQQQTTRIDLPISIAWKRAKLRSERSSPTKDVKVGRKNCSCFILLINVLEEEEDMM